MAELRAGVAGAGAFGGHHARKYAELAGVRLTAVFDVHLDRAQALAGSLGGEGTESFDHMLERVDVLTIATPAASHAALADAALRAGKAVYVEKPLAANLDDGGRLVELAAARRLVLAVGHQERLVFEAMGLLALPEAPIAIEAVRRGTPSPRNRDVSCVQDLMTHDLDLALRLAGCDPLAVEGEGSFDAVEAEVTFDSGLTARFEASRVAERRERTMRLVFASGVVEIDFLAPSFHNTTPHRLDPAVAETAAGRDPLGASVGRFLAAVRGEAPRPAVTGAEGLAALELALAIEDAAGL